MKKRILSGLVALLICAITFVAPLSTPVYAASSVGMGALWDNYLSSNTNDRFGAYLSTSGVEFTRQGDFGAERGGTFGTPKRFYTGSSKGKQEYTPTKISIRYESGDTDYTPIISSTYNTTNNTYSYTYNDYITNNSYDITEIYYNEENNFYKVITVDDNDVTNEYFFEYSPTYISVVSYNGVDNYSCCNSYYFQLPDGRNSYDLTADDVWGTYFIYPDMLMNYDKVAEDDGYTKYLYHFDGNLSNSAAINVDSVPTCSILNFDTGRFGQSLFQTSTANTINKLVLPNTDFDSLDFWVYYSSTFYNSSKKTTESLSYVTPNFIYGKDLSNYGFAYDKSYVPTDCWVHLAFVKDDTNESTYPYDFYVNGVLTGVVYFGWDTYTVSNCDNINNLVFYQKSTSMRQYCTQFGVDELRIIKGSTVYTDNFVPSSQPYDTNKVYVLPDDAVQGNIAIKSDITPVDVRIGGVRPTLTTNGFIYVYTENNIVGDVQQYQNDGWYSVDAVIYDNEQWNTLQNYNLSNYTVEDDSSSEDVVPTPPPTSTPDTDGDGIPDVDDTDDDNDGILDGEDDDSNGNGVADKDEESEGILGKLVNTIVNFIGNLFETVFGGILDLVNILIEDLTTLLDSFTGITGLIGALFGFFPDDVVSVLKIGLSAVFVVVIYKMFKG